MSFMKSKFINILTSHVDLVFRVFAQDDYSVDTFSFGNVTKD
jgi:hypothetical protein